MKKITVLDYHMGNIFSITHALKKIGLEVEVTSNAKDFDNTSALVLPGVGAFNEAMTNLRELELVHPIQEFVKAGKPVLGICLGLQLFFEKSCEFGDTEGLSLFQGEIRKFKTQSDTGEKIRVPNIGWNYLEFVKQSNLLKGLSEKDMFYFVHSFYVEPKNDEDTLTKTNYHGLHYCSSVEKDNVCGFQFHPEKSGKKGLQLLKNWMDQYL